MNERVSESHVIVSSPIFGQRPIRDEAPQKRVCMTEGHRGFLCGKL